MRALLLLSALLAASPALATPHRAAARPASAFPAYGVAAPARPAPVAVGPLRIDNATRVGVAVYVDGQLRGGVEAGDARTFTVPFGAARVVAVDAQGRTLLDQRLRLDARGAALTVLPPATVVTLTNPTGVPLLVRVPGGGEVWVLPGARHSFEARGRSVDVATFFATPRGLVAVTTHRVALRGEAVAAALTAPPSLHAGRPPARGPRPGDADVVLTNLQRGPVTLWVGGAFVATAAPGETLRLDVAAGRHDVALIDARGRLLLDDTVTLRPGEDHRLRVDDGRVYRQADAAPVWVALR